MTIDDYIDTYKSYADDYEKGRYEMGWSSQQKNYAIGRANEYKQVAEWLEELKFLRTWKDDVIAELCKYDANSIEELVRKVFEKIQSKMISLHTDMIFRYGADIIEAKTDAFDELKEWIAKQLKDEKHNTDYDAGYAEAYEKAYKIGKAETLEALLSHDWWNDNQRMLMEEWIKLAKEGI